MVKVLLVEDQDIWFALLKAVIAQKKLKIELTRARHGISAINLLASGEEYDAIIMNCEMPYMNGVQATSSIRKMGYTKPIIAWSGWARDVKEKDFLEAGADDYVERDPSLEMDTLLVALDCALRKYEATEKETA